MRRHNLGLGRHSSNLSDIFPGQPDEIFLQEQFVCVHTNLLDILTTDKQQGPGISSLKLTLKLCLR